MTLAFPYIQYELGKTPQEWGERHGEEFRSAILELAKIRRNLMHVKNPKLLSRLSELALEQWETTKRFSPDLSAELEGIRSGAKASIEDIVILNNYTDFRDIQIPDQGCSTVFVETEGHILAGQTWDMHASAKKFVCVIHVPESQERPEQVLFSMVGCVGMMGYNTHGEMIGVNNLNTKNARAGLIWPALVRETLSQTSFSKMRASLLEAPVTSGHNYLISSRESAEMWEITPTAKERAGHHLIGKDGWIFHTNHCLETKTQAIESPLSSTSTSLERYKSLSRKISRVKNADGLTRLLSDHDGYPNSICVHADELSPLDPSITCGAAVGDLRTLDLSFWRGCPEHAAGYARHDFAFRGGHFELLATPRVLQ